MRALITVAALLVAVQAAGRALPLNIELDGCVQPAEACSATRDVVKLNEDDRKLSFAVDTLRVLGTTRATTGQILDEMELRPLRVYGPAELVTKLVPGAHLRVRAALRLGEMFLMVTAVEPLGD